jgi:hypothetical protein
VNTSTSILKSVVSGDIEVLREKLAGGADPNESAPDRSRVTALMFAVMKRDDRSVRLLLEAGANVDAQDSNGWTALMHAVNKGDSACVTSLLNAGANVAIALPDGITVSNLAANGDPQVARAIGQAVKTWNEREAAKERVFSGNITLLICFRPADLHIEIWDDRDTALALGVSGTRINALIDKIVKLTFIDARCAPNNSAFQDLAKRCINLQEKFTELVKARNWQFGDEHWQVNTLSPIVLQELDTWIRDNVTRREFNIAFGSIR